MSSSSHIEQKPTHHDSTDMTARAQQEALRLLNELEVQTGPWEGWRAYLSGAIAFSSASASASTSRYFAGKLLAGEKLKAMLSESAQENLLLATTAAAIPPAFFLSFNASFSVWNRMLRSLPNLTFAECKQSALPILFTMLSAVVSYKVGWDAWKDAPVGVRTLIATFRGLSALSANGLFAIQMQNHIEGFRASAEMHVLRSARTKLKVQAKNNPEAFIETLSKSRLFERLTTIKSSRAALAKHDVNLLFHSLLAVVNDDDLRGPTPIGPQAGGARKVAYAVGALSALPYFASGQSVVEGLFKLHGPLSFWVLGTAFGVSSVMVNSAIAAIATADAIDRLATKEFSMLECVTLPLKLYFLLGNSLAYAGMALEYPFPANNEILAYTEALLNFFVYLSIGDMAFDNFFTKINSYHLSSRRLLENASASIGEGISLQVYFEELKKSDQAILVRLMDDYLKWALDEALIPFFNQVPQDIVTELFDAPLIAKLTAFEAKRSAQPADKPSSHSFRMRFTAPLPIKSKASLIKSGSIGSMAREATDSPLEPPSDFAIRTHSPIVNLGLHRRFAHSLLKKDDPSLSESLLGHSLP